VIVILKIILKNLLKLNLYCLYIAMVSNIFKPKLSFKFYCEYCDYGTSKKSNIENHKTSMKHIKSMVSKLNSNDIKPKLSSKYTCEVCNKEYKDNSGLWRHKKKCNEKENIEKENIEKEINIDFLHKEDLIMMLIKQNSELIKETSDFKNMMMKVIENGTHNTTNSHNKSFNLQFFLNETCKDAMNIMDFVDSIKLQLSDLERIGEIGYVEGISNIIVKNLNALDVTQRPVHCTDKKRETLYIKDENKWEKEDDKKAKMHKVVRKVADKNVKLLPKFKEEYPDCSKSTSKYSDQYNKIIVESMGGSGDNDYEKEEKIIKRITKEVFIDKEPMPLI